MKTGFSHTAALNNTNAQIIALILVVLLIITKAGLFLS